MIILGIETSCDETAAALINVQENNISILSNIVSSQIPLHKEWGGVVPNLAAREHLKNILPVIETAIEKARIKIKDIDLIAVTNGPGLIPALLVGTNTAKTLSYLWDIPLIGIHHIEGHIYANFIRNEVSEIFNSQFSIFKQIQNSKSQISKQSSIKFPILCLVVSGGHTQLVLMKKHLDYKIIGETQDDAAGEAFDKVARILGLDYPGGPEIAKCAIQNVKRKASDTRSTIRNIRFPRPMINSKDFNFSFSGLKTAVLYLVKKNEKLLKNQTFINEVSYEFQQAVVDVLIAKTIAAAKKYKPKSIMLAGGVSANMELRNQLGEIIRKELSHTEYHIPDTKYSLDNAAMIAVASYFRWQKTKNKSNFKEAWKRLVVNANLPLE